MKKILFCYLVFGAFINLKAQNELETREINGVKISFYENEIPIGNHSLIGLYIGTLGAKPFKLFITKVKGNNCYGYTITGTNKVAFTGTFTDKDTTYKYDIGTEEQLKNSKPFDLKGSVYRLALKEPTSNNKNGKFKLVLHNMDTMGTDGYGSWVSYDKSLNRKIELVGAIEP